MYTSVFLFTKAQQIAELGFWNLKDLEGKAFHNREVKWNGKALLTPITWMLHVCLGMWRYIWILCAGLYTSRSSGKIKGKLCGFCHTTVASLSRKGNAWFVTHESLSVCLKIGALLQVPLNEVWDLHIKSSQGMVRICSYILNISVFEHTLACLKWKQMLKWAVLNSKDSVFLSLQSDT